MKQIINVFILTTVLLITGTTSFAQELDRQADAVQYDFSTFTINGLEIGGPEYTEQDIIRAFGQPDSVELGEFGCTYIMLKEASSIPKNYIPTGGIYAAEIILHTKPKYTWSAFLMKNIQSTIL